MFSFRFSIVKPVGICLVVAMWSKKFIWRKMYNNLKGTVSPDSMEAWKIRQRGGGPVCSLEL